MPTAEIKKKQNKKVIIAFDSGKRCGMFGAVVKNGTIIKPQKLLTFDGLFEEGMLKTVVWLKNVFLSNRELTGEDVYLATFANTHSNHITTAKLSEYFGYLQGLLEPRLQWLKGRKISATKRSHILKEYESKVYYALIGKIITRPEKKAWSLEKAQQLCMKNGKPIFSIGFNDNLAEAIVLWFFTVSKLEGGEVKWA